MRQDVVENFIKKMYPDAEFKIVTYNKLPRFNFNKHNQFIEGESAIFIDMKISKVENKFELIGMLEKFTGFEFSINFL